MPLQPLRILDANLNRLSEGLRFLEEIARFLLNDAELSWELRTLRHNLLGEARPWDTKLLSQRDSEHDVGADLDTIASGANRFPKTSQNFLGEKPSQQDLPGLVRANARRAEESLRVIEELAKLPDIGLMLDSAKFEQGRFSLYHLERLLISKVLRQDKIKWIAGLYVVLDRQALAGRDELAVAQQIIQGAAKVIQLRDKQGKKGELLSLARRLRTLCAESGVLFIINDYLDLALAVDADGLHVGQEDLPLPVVRKELPIDKIVGISVHTVAQAVQAQNEGADYVSVGSIFPTPTKKGATVVGIDRLKEIRQAVSCPLVAIGGINEDNIDQVLSAGADSVALISAVLGKEDVKESTQRLVAKLNLAVDVVVKYVEPK